MDVETAQRREALSDEYYCLLSIRRDLVHELFISHSGGLDTAL